MTTKKINEIEMIEPIIMVCGSATQVCCPEDLFDTIEICKWCGRCV
jgi:hypothetical protein